MEYTYIKNKQGTFSVGFVDLDGEWINMGNYPTAELAAEGVRRCVRISDKIDKLNRERQEQEALIEKALNEPCKQKERAKLH